MRIQLALSKRARSSKAAGSGGSDDVVNDEVATICRSRTGLSRIDQLMTQRLADKRLRRLEPLTRDGHKTKEPVKASRGCGRQRAPSFAGCVQKDAAADCQQDLGIENKFQRQLAFDRCLDGPGSVTRAPTMATMTSARVRRAISPHAGVVEVRTISEVCAGCSEIGGNGAGAPGRGFDYGHRLPSDVVA